MGNAMGIIKNKAPSIWVYIGYERRRYYVQISWWFFESCSPSKGKGGDRFYKSISAYIWFYLQKDVLIDMHFFLDCLCEFININVFIYTNTYTYIYTYICIYIHWNTQYIYIMEWKVKMYLMFWKYWKYAMCLIFIK